VASVDDYWLQATKYITGSLQLPEFVFVFVDQAEALRTITLKSKSSVRSSTITDVNGM
jgi:hypothetical protein